MLFDDENKIDDEHIEKSSDEVNEDSKYYVPEEKIETIFKEPEVIEKVKVEEEEEFVPQESEDYQVKL